MTAALAAPEVSAELVEDLLEALAELEIEVADESEAPALRGRFPDRLAREHRPPGPLGPGARLCHPGRAAGGDAARRGGRGGFDETVASLLGMGIGVVEG